MSFVPGYCTLCRSRCGSLNEIRNGRLVGVTPLPSHPTGGALCAKGRSAPEQVASPLRLTRPLRRTAPRDAADPGWVEISWDEALDDIASRLAATRERHGAEAVAFAVTTPSGTPMVDSFEWVERFIRCFGSPNLLYAVEVCGWHKDYAHALTFGRGIGVPDLEHAEVIVLWGHNPARTWLAQASRVASARQRGATVVVVDPKQDGSGQQADLWMRVRPGADAALALGAIRHLVATRRYDENFVREWTNAPLLVDVDTGRLLRAPEIWPDAAENARVACTADGGPQPFEPMAATPADLLLETEGELRDRSGRLRRYASVLRLLARHVEPYAPERVAHLTWIDEASIHRFNALFEHGPKLAYHAWTGVGQHTNATQTERTLATLYALTGACDREGGNLWTVAPPYRAVNAYHELLAPEQRSKALGLRDLPLGPPRFGWITMRDLRAAVLKHEPYEVNTLVSFGTNLVVTQADAEHNLRTLRALDFHVHVDMFMNPTAAHADIVLPASMPWEREALKCGFEITQAAVEHVQLRARMIVPPGEARADYEIVMALAQRLGMQDAFFGCDIEAAWNHQLEPLGVTVAELREHPEGMRFPQPFTYRKFAARGAHGSVAGFDTPTRRVELYAEALLDIGQPALPTFVEPAQSPASRDFDPAFPIVLTTAKSGWFVHSSHRHVVALRKKAPAPQVQIGTELAARLDLHDGDWARVVTAGGAARLQVRTDRHLHDRVAVAEFGWWQGCESLGYADTDAHGDASTNINAILRDAERDPVSGSVPLRAVMCRIEPEPAFNRGRWHGARPFRIAAKRTLAAEIEAFEFEPTDGAALPDFLPGQHVIVSLPDFDTRRAYSLTGPNRAPARLSIAVRLARAPNQPDGRMSSRLHEMQEGDMVWLSPPAGVFTMPVETERPLVLAAGGIGVTPFVGHLEAIAQRYGHGGAGIPPDVILIHTCRNGAAHPFRDRLRELAAQIGTVTLITVYWDPLPSDRPGVDYDAAGGHDFRCVTDAWLARRPLAYLCGSPAFLAGAREGLVRRGLPDFDVFEETFAAEVRVPATLEPRSVRIDGEDAGFDWSPGHGTLLDAADRAGIGLPSGCRVGQCESCAMTIAEGNVAHLAAYDGPPDRCLPCIAVPLTPLVLRR
jgi:anaerobic selenocysteine-containing dehydrogenase/ferredoxin-NADP reductase